MQTGVCRLCKKTGALHKSHFLPAAIYAQLRDDTHTNPHPVLITEDVSLISSKQIVEHLLCFDCEQRFSKLGEAWVLGNMAREGSFPFQDTLRKAGVLDGNAEFAVYSASAIPDVDMDALGYFALSVFWRSAAHRWRNVKGFMDGISLGPYEEKIRLFLLGGPFPSDIALHVVVWPTKDVVRVAYTPCRGKADGFHCFSFMIPGIEFRLLTGKMIPYEVLESCSYRSSYRYIYSTMQTINDTVKTMGNMMRTSQPTKALLVRKP